MLAISSHKGFHLSFENGWTVSVQFGPGNYCEHHGSIMAHGDWDKPKNVDIWKSDNAEIAAWNRNNEWFQFADNSVEGWQSANDVARFIGFISSLDSDVVPGPMAFAVFDPV